MLQNTFGFDYRFSSYISCSFRMGKYIMLFQFEFFHLRLSFTRRNKLQLLQFSLEDKYRFLNTKTRVLFPEHWFRSVSRIYNNAFFLVLFPPFLKEWIPQYVDSEFYKNISIL